MKDDCTTNSHCLTYTFLSRKVVRMYFLNLGVKGLYIVPHIPRGSRALTKGGRVGVFTNHATPKLEFGNWIVIPLPRKYSEEARLHRNGGRVERVRTKTAGPKHLQREHKNVSERSYTTPRNGAGKCSVKAHQYRLPIFIYYYYFFCTAQIKMLRVLRKDGLAGTIEVKLGTAG